MPRDWLELLREEAARTSIAAAGRRIGYARTSVSLALAGKYPGNTEKMEAAVLAVLGTVDCPHLGFAVAPSRCVASSGKMPTSSPGDLRLWRACQGCPHKPETQEVTP